jgi:hypothetical protein
LNEIKGKKEIKRNSKLFFEHEREKVRINVPLFLDWVIISEYIKKIICICFCCRCVNKRCNRFTTPFTAFSELNQSAGASVHRDLDLIRFIRAKRLHGYGMSMLLNSEELKNSAALAYTRPFK